MKKDLMQTIKVIVLGLVLGLGVSYIHAGPPANPSVAPTAPANLTVSVNGTTNTLNWSSSNFGTGCVSGTTPCDWKGYVPERKTGSGSFVEISGPVPPITTATDGGLAPTTQYSYRVKACNGITYATGSFGPDREPITSVQRTCSSYSNTVTVTTGSGAVTIPVGSQTNAWVGPTSTPPQNNVFPPVNVGPVSQNKNGALGVTALSVFGNALIKGSLALDSLKNSSSSSNPVCATSTGTVEPCLVNPSTSYFVTPTDDKWLASFNASNQVTAAKGAGNNVYSIGFHRSAFITNPGGIAQGKKSAPDIYSGTNSNELVIAGNSTGTGVVRFNNTGFVANGIVTAGSGCYDNQVHMISACNQAMPGGVINTICVCKGVNSSNFSWSAL